MNKQKNKRVATKNEGSYVGTEKWKQNHNIVTKLWEYCDYSKSKRTGNLYKRVLRSADDPWSEMKVLFTNMVATLEMIDEPERQIVYLESALKMIGKYLEPTVQTAADTLLRLDRSNDQ